MSTVLPLDPSSPMAAVVDHVLGASGWDGRRPVFVESDGYHFRSSASASVISIRIGEEVVARVFCKEGPVEYLGTETFRWGLAYEAAVYRDVLTPLQISVPAFYDSWTDPDTRSCVLAIEHVADAVRVGKVADPAAGMTSAAAWIGGFHARLDEKSLTESQRALLRVHDGRYLRQWFERAGAFLAAADDLFPGLADLARSPGPFVDALVAAPHCVVHGDFSPNNVLISGRTVVTVDWESAAIGAGAVDLASLIERWPPEIVDACVEAYTNTRWGGERPVDFGRHLAAGRIYHLLRVPGLNAALLDTEKGCRRAGHLAASLESWESE